jgi:ABC-type branched-subunit amino acid transport system ATPase component
LLTEQNVHEACRIVDRAYVLNLGRIVANLASPQPEEVASLIATSLRQKGTSTKNPKTNG